MAHHVSMVAVQAETARLTTPGMPAAGVQKLSAIGDTAQAALTEMRRLLGVLREDARTDVAERRPQLGLGQLNELLDEARDASGAGAPLILRGPPVRLDPGVELAAYRIVQEALTNARRHAPGVAVDVELHYTDDALLRLRIRDNGPGPPQLHWMAATDCPACENAPQPSVASCALAPRRAAGSLSWPGCPPRPRRPGDRRAATGADRRGSERRFSTLPP
ncbi:MAG TPA: histidine kinase [Actinomycetota bacterium]